MDENDIKKFMHRAKQTATRYGFEHDAEDIAQEVLADFVAHPDSGRTVQQATVDAIRSLHGRSTSEEKLAIQYAKPIHDLLPSEEPETDEMSHGDFDRIIAGLDGIDRVLFVLRYVWGFDQTEIAYCFGTTESRICQRFAAIETSLYQRVAAIEQRQGKAISKETSGEETSVLFGQAQRIQAQEAERRSGLLQETHGQICEVQPGESESYFQEEYSEWLQ